MTYYKNLFFFIGIVAFFNVLDFIFGNDTDLTDMLIISFFLVWNLNNDHNIKGKG